jgi:hypothetical protein
MIFDGVGLRLRKEESHGGQLTMIKEIIHRPCQLSLFGVGVYWWRFTFLVSKG